MMTNRSTSEQKVARLYIVDWNSAVLASNERDFMCPGGAQGFTDLSPQEEDKEFFGADIHSASRKKQA